MLNTTHGQKGMVTSPHHRASQAGLDILNAGGTAIEAAVATAAALAVVYPHMNSIGGDGFWLIAQPGEPPVGIDASGRAAAAATPDLYGRQGLTAIPWRGGLAANTVAGTVSGWKLALDINARSGGGMALADLLGPVAELADCGVRVTDSLAATIAEKEAELRPQPGFAQAFLPDGMLPLGGSVLKQPALAATFRRLIDEGLDSFYRGGLAQDLATDLAAAGSPLSLDDLGGHEATQVEPLTVKIANARLFNLPPPTQGLASLLILALYDRLAAARLDSVEHLHGLIEATKEAFVIRDRSIGDPGRMKLNPQGLLDDGRALDRMARGIDPNRAAPWPHPSAAGDTVWLGCVDRRGQAVSMIQSTYFEFGSGLVLPRTGVTWQNRGCAFRLVGDGPNRLAPRAKPFHTLNPAMAAFDDGRLMTYGTMGGEGQPQTQAAIFTRYGLYGQGLQAAVTAPRWLLGRTWGQDSVTLKLEDRFPRAVTDRLRSMGHAVEIVAPFTSLMGHAGAIVRHADGGLAGAADPRSDGAVCAR
jgi:gamma-glutamyltranspeptidase